MADNIKMRAQLKNGITEVKVLMSHPMETGRRKSDFGDVIPAHFIQQVSAFLNQQPVMQAQWGTGISKNPYLTFYLSQAKQGDMVKIVWLDNRGKQGEAEIAVS
jgi:sulfur-oxidizing protein SoxZ